MMEALGKMEALGMMEALRPMEVPGLMEALGLMEAPASRIEMEAFIHMHLLPLSGATTQATGAL